MVEEQSEGAASTSPPHFEDLIANAISFLDRAVQELSDKSKIDRLKFSAIFFYQSVELFVKARLLQEHWSLVLADPKLADRSKFEKGDFKSVDLREAVARLKRVCGEDLSAAQRAFEPVRERRNRAIHFHAAELHLPPSKADPRLDLMGGETPETLALVGEQCRAWYELHTLLAGAWRHYLSTAQTLKIRWLDGRMRELQPYLQARFDRLTPQLRRIEADGYRISDCEACCYRASVESSTTDGFINHECLVCGTNGTVFRFACPVQDCDGDVVVSADGIGGKCFRCEHELDVDELVYHFQPKLRPKDAMLQPGAAYCAECGAVGTGQGTVAWVESAGCYICFSCLAEHDSVSECEYCSEQVTGDTSDTYWLGCMMCDGRAGNMKDD